MFSLNIITSGCTEISCRLIVGTVDDPFVRMCSLKLPLFNVNIPILASKINWDKLMFFMDDACV